METPEKIHPDMNKIDVLCSDVLALTDEDFREIEQVIEDQRNWNIPLLPKTTEWQHQLADYNERVLQKIRELKAIIAEGESIVQPEEKPDMFS